MIHKNPGNNLINPAIKKFFKYVVFSSGGLFVIIVLSLWILPLAYHNRIHRELSGLINREMGADATFTDFRVSFLRNFPAVHLELYDLAIHDRDTEPLKISDLRILLNLWQLFKDTVDIKRIAIRDASLRLITDAEGNHSRLFTRAKEDTTLPAKKLSLSSKDIVLHDVSIYEENRIKHNLVSIRISEARLVIMFDKPEIRVTGKVTGTLDTLVSRGSVILSDLPVVAENAAYLINSETGTQKILDGVLKVHELVLIPRMTLSFPPEGRMIDLSITCENDLNDFLALLRLKKGIPFTQVNPHARAALIYRQKGLVDARHNPLTEIDFSIRDGKLQSEKLPYPITDLFLKGSYTTGAEHSSKTTHIIIDTIHAEIANSYAEGKIDILNLEDPFVVTRLDSRIDLGNFIKQGSSTGASGLINIDLDINGKISDFEKYDLKGKDMARGEIRFRDVNVFLVDSTLKIKLDGGLCTLKNRILAIERFDGTINDEKFHIAAKFDNADQLFFRDRKKLTGTINANFNLLDVDGLWQARDQKNGHSKILDFLIANSILRLNIDAHRITGKFGEINDAQLQCELSNDTVYFKMLNFGYLGLKVIGTGAIAFKNDILSYSKAIVKISGNKLDLTGGIHMDGQQPRSSANKPTLNLPAVIDINAGIALDTVIYNGTSLRNLTCNLRMSVDQLHLSDLEAQLPEGMARIELDVKNYADPDPVITGTAALLFDTLHVRTYLGTLSGIGTGKNKARSVNSIWSRIPGKFDLQVKLKAGRIIYDNVATDSVIYSGSLCDHKAEIRDLSIVLGNGKVGVKGVSLRNTDNTVTTYLNTTAINLDLQKILDFFDGFGQKFLTPDNTAGTISWDADLYMTFDSTFRRIDENNLWRFDFRVVEARLTDVAPLEKALSFIRYKTKENILVSNMNFQAFLHHEKLFFHDVVVKNSISDMQLFGSYVADDTLLNMNMKLNMSDLFFKSKERRILETEGGRVDLGKERDINILFDGTKEKHQLKLSTKKKYNESNQYMSRQFESYNHELRLRIDELTRNFKSL